ncbi:tetratricopeptide repeat protein [Streptomyces nitrosporeus]|uniref:tetratricopeptide repeat protein n=1 Tax=Streptomyces nitrosporeus TaxID=28894 RepID=UPI00331A30B5
MTQSVRAENGFAYGVVGADIHVFGDGIPVYLLQRWRPPPAADDSFLREVPSRMLNARFAVVEFTGRTAELAALRHWRDEGPQLAVRWLHAPGGQGKTRLADHFACESADDGWQVVTATHGPGSVIPPPGSQDLGAAADGTLLVVDYADRWPLSHLLWLFSNALLHRPEVPARILLLARGDDSWPAVRASVANLQAGTSTQFLPPLSDGTQEREGDGSPRTEMFAVAHGSFAARYGVPSLRAKTPAALAGDDFGLTLSVHLAALVAVDAHVTGRRPPPDLAGLTCYLLDREHLHWARLHGEGGHEIDPTARTFTTPPDAMNRTVFTAALTGPMAPAPGSDVVAGLDLKLPAHRVLADHAVCYPPADPAQETVLEPLYPDRLSEDFLALTLPGHHAEYPAQSWARATVAALLTGTTGPGTPLWAPRAVTFLASAAQRWPHVGPRHLYPLLAAAPQVAVAAGSAALTTLARLDDIAPELLEAVAAHFPPFKQPHPNLDPGIAAVSTRLLPHRLSRAGHLDDPGVVRHEHGVRLYRAGLLEESLAAAEENVRDYRALDRVELRYPAEAELVERNLATALTAYGTRLSAVGRRADALAATEESIGILRGLAGRDERYRSDLASALLNRGRDLCQADRWDDATVTTQECVALFRELAAGDPETHEPDLSASLVALGLCLGFTATPGESVAALQEGITILRRLSRTNAAAHTEALAEALSNLAKALWRTGEPGISVAQEAVALLRRLAAVHPVSYESELANVLAGSAVHLLYAGQGSEALSAAHESVSILRRLAGRQPQVHANVLAEALASLSIVLLAVGRHDDAIAVTDEAVAIRRRMAGSDPGFEARLAVVLLLAVNLRTDAGGSMLEEAVVLLAEAGAVIERHGTMPAQFSKGYHEARIRLADRLTAEGYRAAADDLRRAAPGPPAEEDASM